MEKYAIFISFILLFAYLIRKDTVYLIPMIYLFYNNINGLFHVEDFAIKGLVNFMDYGFILSIIAIVLIFFTFNQQDYSTLLNSMYGLFLLICIHFFYYIFLFAYSIFLQGSIEWPIKIGRYYLYEISVILFFLLLYNNPKEKFEKVIHFLEIYTIVFSVMYILYNYFNIDFYADEPFEILETDKGEVTRSYAAFPTFLMYFYCISLIKFFKKEGNLIFNILIIFIYLACIVAAVTRGLMIGAGVIFIVAYFISPNRITNLLYIFVFFGLGILILSSINFFESGSFLALVDRSSEVSNSGLQNTANFAFRTEEFFVIFNNVVDFNPMLGFGFINMQEFGLYKNYSSDLLFAGSADNGFSNLLGVSGFIGLVFFLIILLKWAIINIQLQALKIDGYSKAHFLFFIYVLLTFMYNNYNCYLQGFGLFLIYDLLIYRQNKNTSLTIKSINF